MPGVGQVDAGGADPREGGPAPVRNKASTPRVHEGDQYISLSRSLHGLSVRDLGFSVTLSKSECSKQS